MSDLQIDYSNLNAVSQNVISKGEEFASLLNRVKTINGELASVWQGTDASKYSGAVEVQAQTMDKLVTTINEIGEFLAKVSRAYQEAVEANADAING